MNDLKKWIQIRKDLYLQIEKEVRHRLGEDTPELMQYHKTYQKEFLKSWQVSTKEELLNQIQKVDMVLMGDFHALNQSQKAQMRVLRQLPQVLRTRSLVLGVEFFEARSQKEIDAFLAGKLSEKDFLKKIQWSERWGFSWETYRPLVRWAQRNKIPVRGLNKYYHRRNAKTLKSRDEFAAEQLIKLRKGHPDSLVFVIYGDLHLASSHLPGALKKAQKAQNKQDKKTAPLKVLRIFQNAESLYFKLLEKGIESSVDLIQLSDGSFCLQSVPPWVKWQNYLMYLERAYDLELDDEDEEDEADPIPLDYTEHVGRFVKLISEELKLGIGAESLSVYTAEDSAFWLQINQTYPDKVIKWIETLIGQEVSFYLPEIQGAYLARPTVNHAAALAMRYLHGLLCQQKNLLLPGTQTFMALIWLETVGYFGSKLINHKRKTDTIVDIKASLASKAPHDSGKEALQLALSQKMHELMVISSAASPGILRRVPKRKESYLAAAKLLGGLLGERLYGGYRKGRVSGLTWASFLRKNIEQDSFSVVYYDIAELAESLPAPFKSKREKL